MSGPLHGLRVLDLSRVLAGPYCTMMLGDMGAEVIKVEQPGSGDDTRGWGPPWVGNESAYYLSVNRNKRSVTLNLKHQRGRELLFELAQSSDVMIENFKAGALAGMGLGYEQLRGGNPKLIHCSITGYGPDGPYSERPGYDFIAQGMGGIMSITGEPDGQPMKLGIAIADVTTGMFACISILAALRHRDQTGQGQHIDLSLLESVVSWLVNAGGAYLMSGVELPRYGNGHPNIVPYRLFKARDKWFIVATGNDRQFYSLCGVVGRPELSDDARFHLNRDRVNNREQIEDILAAIFVTRDAEDWTRELLGVGVPAGPVNSIPDVFRDPQVLARKMMIEVDHPVLGILKQAGFPFKFSETPAEPRRHPPQLGEHTEEVLRELLDLPADEITRLRAEGAI